MPNPLDVLSAHVHSKLLKLQNVLPGRVAPSLGVVRELLTVSFYASLRTEEGRLLRASVTLANPDKPQDLPRMLRHNYPTFTTFKEAKAFDARSLAKLSRAVDPWAASIAVFGSSESNIRIWGLVDQAVGANMRLYREPPWGFDSPGIITVAVQGVGDLSVYHESLFLGGLRQEEVILRQHRAFESATLMRQMMPRLMPYARAIYSSLPEDLRGPADGQRALARDLFRTWSDTIARMCIGVRRSGTGGTFLLTDVGDKTSTVSIGHRLPYKRLASAWILRVLNDSYHTLVESPLWDPSEMIPSDIFVESIWADGDLEDRERELTGSIKLVSSLACLDGATVLTPTLELVGFGAKINAPEFHGKTYDGPSLETRKRRLRQVDIKRLGTRHGSALRYCAWDRKCLAVVVSQDGDVRMFMDMGGRMAVWDNIKIEGDSDDLRAHRRMNLEALEKRGNEPPAAGYTEMPTSLEELMRPSRAKPTRVYRFR